jgi:GntR family transcriptional regulator, transcriptional repressor for pyruvate dehydrogenase complex
MSEYVLSPPPRGDRYGTVSPSRISGAIVEQIRALIRSAELRPGDRLPSERRLAERMGVSRVTVRDALRVLEAGGLIEIRVGARGGAFVTSPSSTRLGSGLADLIGLSPLTAAEIGEARHVFELGIVPLVVERATEADLAGLRALLAGHRAARDGGGYDAAMAAAFHVGVAACTHNAAIEMLVHCFHGPLRPPGEQPAPAGACGVDEHRDFLAALARRDAARAATILRAHLVRVAG